MVVYVAENWEGVMTRTPVNRPRSRSSVGGATWWLVASLALLGFSANPASSSAVVVVNDAADTLHNPGCATTGTGDCTLRDAITFADTGTGDTIDFNIPGCGGVCTITVTGALPDITKAVVIDGYSQPGAAVNTLADGDNAVLLIQVSGGGGLTINGTGGSTIEGLVLNGTVAGIVVFGGDGNHIVGDFIGTNPVGTAGVGAGSNGVFVLSSNNTIGGTSPADRNVISGVTGGNGIQIGSALASNNVVIGNFIGTNAAGTAAIGNGTGISTQGASTTIGGTASGAGNLISGNQSPGISSSGPNALIEGNRIGIDSTGLVALGNGIGVTIAGGNATGTHLGGTAVGAGNVIVANKLNGVVLSTSGVTVEGNFIGTDASGAAIVGFGNGQFGAFTAILVNGNNNVIGGTAAGAGNVIAHNFGNGVTVTGTTSSGNTIRGNSIFDNNATAGAPGLGIHLGSGMAVTANDACDADTGPNGMQNYPAVTSASAGGGNLTIGGTLDSTASGLYQIDLYLTSCEPSGYGEGQHYLGSTTASTDGSCHGSFNATLPIVGSGRSVTATATDASGNTSEFSADFAVGGSLALHYYTLPPCRVVDTRSAAGPLGGPALFAGGPDRVFALLGHCGIPADAISVSLNITITGSTGKGDLRLYPAGSPLPLVSTINYGVGQTRANNAVAALSCFGALATHLDQPAGTQAQAIIDVLGYFK
jgi:hypothetical protein